MESLSLVLSVIQTLAALATVTALILTILELRLARRQYRDAVLKEQWSQVYTSLAAVEDMQRPVHERRWARDCLKKYEPLFMTADIEPQVCLRLQVAANAVFQGDHHADD